MKTLEERMVDFQAHCLVTVTFRCKVTGSVNELYRSVKNEAVSCAEDKVWDEIPADWIEPSVEVVKVIDAEKAGVTNETEDDD